MAIFFNLQTIILSLVFFITSGSAFCVPNDQDKQSYNKLIVDSGIIKDAGIIRMINAKAPTQFEQDAIKNFLADRYFSRESLAETIFRFLSMPVIMSFCFSVMIAKNNRLEEVPLHQFLGLIASFVILSIPAWEYGRDCGMRKIYRQLTRKFGDGWLSWGLDKVNCQKLGK
jgi:hypothetical protein